MKTEVYSKQKIAQSLGFARGCFYYRSVLAAKDRLLEAKIAKEYETDDTLGHRSLAPLVGAGKDRVRRVMKKYGIQARLRQKKYVYPGKTSIVFPNLAGSEEIALSRLVVFSDIFQFELLDGTKVYGCFALLKSTRQILSLLFDYSMRSELVAETINRIDFCDLSEAIWHTDQGRQFGSFEVLVELMSKGFIASMSRAGTPTDNSFAERFVGSFKHAVVRRKKYETLGEFLEMAAIWINFYNGRRPHRSLGMLSPNTYAPSQNLPTVPPLSQLTI